MIEHVFLPMTQVFQIIKLALKAIGRGPQLMTPPGEIYRDSRDSASDRLLLPFDGILATRSTLSQFALTEYETAWMSGRPLRYAENQAPDKVNPGTDQAPDKATPATEKLPHPRGRIDDDDFDITLPLSNFKTVDSKVSRSGRPLSDQGGVEQILDKLHPGKSRAYQREHTAIIELRDEDQQMDDPAITVLNKKEVLDEEALCRSSTPPIEYHRFKMQSKQFQSPQKIDNIVDTINRAVDAGKNVSIHCFHGSDRSGLISAAYKLNSDVNLKNDLKNNLPDKAYKEVVRYMIENGCDPASYTMLFQSLRQYVDWKSEQLNGKPNSVDGKNQVAIKDVQLDPVGQARIDALAKQMYADPRFQADPIAVYKEKLISVADEYDPATHSAFYKALRQKYVDGPPPANKKTGAYQLPNLSLIAAA